MTLYVILPIILICVGAFFIYKKFIRSAVVASIYGEHDMSVLEIKVPKTEADDSNNTSDTTTLAAEHLFASLHGLLNDDSNTQEHFSFEVEATALGIKFYVTAPSAILKFVESQVYAQYPTAQMKVVEDYVKPEIYSSTNYDVRTFSQKKAGFFPIKIFRDFEVDPLSNIVSTLAEVKENEGICFQYLVKPLADGWQQEGHDYVGLMTGGKSGGESFFSMLVKDLLGEVTSIFGNIPVTLFRNPEGRVPVQTKPGSSEVKLTTFQELEVSAIENKLAKMGFEVIIRVLLYSDDVTRIDSTLRSINASFKQFTHTSLNELMLNESQDKYFELEKYKGRVFDKDTALILTNEELATLFHLPSSRATAPNVSWVFAKTGEPPTTLPIDNCTYIGETLFRGKQVRFGMKNEDDRLRHMYLIGKTGTGKSTLLETMVTQDILSGAGVGVLDPHGETIENVMNRIPDNRIDDVILFDPSDAERPVGLNLLEMDSPDQKNLMASALVAAIRQHFDYSWGPRLEYLLNYALLTLLDVPGTSMLGITRLLEDKNYQNYILHQVKDPVVKRFWEYEYKEMKGNQKLVTEAIAPIQNKVNRFLASTTIRNILGQRKSTIDIWDAMQSGKILLINLSKGKIGADNANLLGALIVSRIQFMALQRAKMPYEERRPFYLYVDEFQNFATGSFEEILSESRKYKLGLYLTHQFTAQLPEELLKAVFGNVGTIATFSLGAPDAHVLASEFAPYFNEEDIISLERFQIYIKLMIDGMTSLPFSAKILLPWAEGSGLVPKTGNKEKIIAASREKYGKDRAYVEDIIGRWVERPFDKGMAIAEENRRKSEGAATKSVPVAATVPIPNTDAISGGAQVQSTDEEIELTIERDS